MADVKKVGQDEEKGKAIFDPKTATRDGKSCIEDGKLVAVPDNFSLDKHKPLKKNIFKSVDVFLDYRVVCLEYRVQKDTENIEKFRKRANVLRKFGDEKTRRKAAKIERMREQLKALEAEVEADGIDLSEL